VRQAAPLIPVDNDKLVAIDECSEEWSEFIVWWRNNHHARTQFLSREVLFAASNAEIRRQAEHNGVSMKDRRSKDPQAREAWSKRFNAWYFGIDTPADAQLDNIIGAKPIIRCPTIQHYEFTTDDGITSEPRGFINTITAPTDCLDGGHYCCNEDNDINKAKTEQVEVRDLSVTVEMNINIKSMQPKSLHEAIKSRAPPLVISSTNFNVSAASSMDEIDTTCGDVPTEIANVSKIEERTQDRIIAKESNPDDRQKRMSGVDTGIVGQGIQCNRREFLDRIRTKVQTARAKANQLAGRSRNLHGIELFRYAVRMVVLLGKITTAHTRRGFNLQHSRTIVTDNAFDLFDFDCDFDALNKKQPPKVKAPRFDPKAVKDMIQRNELKLLKRCFTAMLHWKNNQISTRDELKAKVAKADKAYRDSVLRRLFHKYRTNVNELVEERLANEKDQVDETILCDSEVEVDLIESKDETPSSELKQPSPEKTVSLIRETCHLRFETDQTLFTPYATQSNIYGLRRSEYRGLFANGIELMQTHLMQSLSEDPIELYDGETLRKMKYDKLKSGKSNGVNIFDVPPDVLANSCAVDGGYSCTEYKMREKKYYSLSQS